MNEKIEIRIRNDSCIRLIVVSCVCLVNVGFMYYHTMSYRMVVDIPIHILRWVVTLIFSKIISIIFMSLPSLKF